MSRLGPVAFVLAGVLGIGAAAAPQAEPPPGARISASLEYVARVPGTERVVEGKFDRVRDRDVLIVTGRFGFKTLDVGDPLHPRLLDTFQPPEILGPDGYWQDEDMELGTPIRRTFARSATSSTCPRAIRSAASTRAGTSGRVGRRAATTSPTWDRSPPASAATAGPSGSPTSGTRSGRGCSRSRSTSGATTG